MNQSRNQSLIYIIVVILVAGVAFALLNDRNEPETKFGRAMEDIGDGVKDAGRELDPNRTPGEKFGDAVDDLGDDIQDATDSN